MSENWEPFPLNLLILKIIERRDGLISENDLVSLIEQELGYRPGHYKLQREIMNLEINGKIQVTNVKKNHKHIKLVQKRQNFLAIGEE